MLELISPEAAMQVIGGKGGSVTVGVGCSAGIGGVACGVTVGASITKPINLPKPKPVPDRVSPGQRAQTDHANDIQGPTGKQPYKH